MAPGDTPQKGPQPQQAPQETGADKAPKSLAELERALMGEFDRVRDEKKKKIVREMDKLRAGYNSKMFKWNYDNATGAFLNMINKKTEKLRSEAEVVTRGPRSSETISRLTELKEQMEESLELDVQNIIALLNNVKGPEFRLTKEGLANLELYISTAEIMMQDPTMKPLADIFKDLTLIQSLDDKTYKVLEGAFLTTNRDMVVLASTILRLVKGSVKEAFTKRFIDEKPEYALKTLLFANYYGGYTAFEMKKYFEYAENTYRANPDKKYQDAREGFQRRIAKFDDDAKEYQACNKIQERVRERIAGLGTQVYGEDASSRLNPAAILKFGGRVVAWTAIGGNALANRPMLMEIYKEEGLFPAISSYATMPYVAGSGALLFGLNRMDSDERLGDILIGKKEKDAKEYALGLKNFLELTEMHSTWGMFLENDGAGLLAEYTRHLQSRIDGEKEPTIRDFKNFLMEKEKDMNPATRPSRYLGKVLSGEFEKDETDNLKMYIRLMEEQKTTNQQEFNARLDEGRQAV